MATSSNSNIEIMLEDEVTSAKVASLWQAINRVTRENPQAKIVVNAKDLNYIDNTGIAFLYDLMHRQRPEGAEIIVSHLNPSLENLIPSKTFNVVLPETPPHNAKTFIEGIGKATNEQLIYVSIMFRFLAKCINAVVKGAVGRETIRWKELFSIATQAGANAIPIVLLIGFLMGVIIAFEIGLVAQQFGAVLFVVDGIGISMFRELGPLMTAIIFAGRTGAAFAAEIGTKKINEEINALYTFGIDPLNFLVLPRLLASLIVLPLLTVLADIVGVIGGAIVLLKFNIGFAQFYQELLNSLAAWDFMLGLIKALTFGFIVAAIGCERGLTTGVGASAVGLSATSAVVSSIIWIVIVDGFFAVLTS